MAPLAAVLVVTGVAGAVVATSMHTSTPDLVPVRAVGVDGVEIDVGARPAADPAGDGSAVCAPVSLAMAGPLDGSAGPGTEVRAGVRRAVERHNTANAGCQVQLKDVVVDGDEPDDGGDDGGAALGEALADVYTIGLVAAAVPSGAVGDDARIPIAVVAPHGDPARVAGGPWQVYGGVADPRAAARAAGTWLRADPLASRVCLLDDGTEIAAQLARPLLDTLGDTVVAGCTGVATDALATARPDAVVYSGAAGPAADVAQLLVSDGSDARLVYLDGASAREFVSAAGSAATGALTPRADGPAPPGYGSASAAVAFDLATVMLRGIDAGVLTREQMDRWMRTYDGPGLTGDLAWQPDGRLARPTVWLWEVR